MSNEPLKFAPQRLLAEQLRLNPNPDPMAPQFLFDRCKCVSCPRERRFADGKPLLFDLQFQGMLWPLKIILNELPESGQPNAWSHCGTVSEVLTKRTYPLGWSPDRQAPGHDWASACPICKPHDSVAEARQLEGDLRRLGQEGDKLRAQPRKCHLCGDARDGVKIDVMAKFQDGVSIAIVNLLEMDGLLRDFIHGKEATADHWAFHGVLDLTKGDRSSSYLWTATCPKCIKVGMTVASRAVARAPSTGLIQ